MRVINKTQGFTIVETLIVLAVSSALFVSVVLMLSGRQGRTQFAQSIQDEKSRIQQVINDVSSGFYANTNNFTCTANPLGPHIVVGTGNQGGNTGCIFLGKVVQFQVAGTADPEQTRIYTVAGLQRNSSGEEVSTRAEAMPLAIAPPTGPDATTRGQLLYGLTTKPMGMYYGSPRVQIGAIGFSKSLASYSDGTIASGSQQIDVIPIKGSSLNATQLATVAAINDHNAGLGFANSTSNPSTGVSICFVSNSSQQSGLITIGGNNRQLSVTLSIKENRTCS